jgi:hypothetical protein
MPIAEDSVKEIIKEFAIDISSTSQVHIKGLGSDTKLFEVDADSSPLMQDGVGWGRYYIIDTPECREVACHPHIVGDGLRELCYKVAVEFREVLNGLGLFDCGSLAIVNILRGSSGYRLVDLFDGDVPTFTVRTQYRGDGYRSHTDNARCIGVTYRDYFKNDHRFQGVSTVVVPDTFATGRSVEAALQDLFLAGLEPETVLLYGFTAVPSLVMISEVCEAHGLELVSFSLCDISQLAYNNYDMPIYGLDESLYTSMGGIRRMGSIIDPETLKNVLPQYVAGMDQPGDWSERQSTLFNGRGNEVGDMMGHLTKSLRLIESLNKINREQPWYTKLHSTIADRELKMIREALESLKRHVETGFRLIE